MTSPNDRILVRVEPNAQSVLLAKCMQMLEKYSDHPITVEFASDERSVLFERVGITVSEPFGEYDKTAESDCFDDICAATLEN
ncbi:MAG: hypothetical protein MR284_07035, partial [Clostridiales bacterium]|nr:hypothetical protein [Clostridiales bacterium]